MDLVIGFVNSAGPLKDSKFPTCVFAGDYNTAVAAQQRFSNILGDEIQVLAVFFGKGSQAQQIQTSLQEHIQCKTIGWFDATPGGIVDSVHFMLCPKSITNNFSRSADKLVAPAEDQSNVCDANSPGDPEHAKPKTRARTRAPKNGKPTDSA